MALRCVNCGENEMRGAMCFDYQPLRICFVQNQLFNQCLVQNQNLNTNLNNQEDFEDSLCGSCDETPDLLAETGAPLEAPVRKNNLYQRLARVWSDTSKLTPLRQNMWVAIESLPVLPCRFGVTISDLQALATELAWDFPFGIAAINLDRCKTLVFTPDHGPNVARVDSALAWLRQFEGSLGLAMRKNGDEFEFGFVDVLWMPGQSTLGSHRRDRFLEAVALVVGSTRDW